MKTHTDWRKKIEEGKQKKTEKKTRKSIVRKETEEITRDVGFNCILGFENWHVTQTEEIHYRHVYVLIEYGIVSYIDYVIYYAESEDQESTHIPPHALLGLAQEEIPRDIRFDWVWDYILQVLRVVTLWFDKLCSSSFELLLHSTHSRSFLHFHNHQFFLYQIFL